MAEVRTPLARLPQASGGRSDRSGPYLSKSHNELEDVMENLVGIGQIWGGSFGFFGGLGVFFIGIGVPWWISLQARDKKNWSARTRRRTALVSESN
jgi:hypothetical protein